MNVRFENVIMAESDLLFETLYVISLSATEFSADKTSCGAIITNDPACIFNAFFDAASEDNAVLFDGRYSFHPTITVYTR